MGINLSEKAMVASLSLHLWRAGKTDKKVTEETNERYGAAKTAGRYYKKLMHEQVKPVYSAAREVDLVHKEKTLPWDDDGKRILLTSAYFKYTEALEQALRAFEEAKSDFVTSVARAPSEGSSRFERNVQPG